MRQRQECCMDISKTPWKVQSYHKTYPEAQSPMGKVAFGTACETLHKVQESVGKNISEYTKKLLFKGGLFFCILKRQRDIV